MHGQVFEVDSELLSNGKTIQYVLLDINHQENQGKLLPLEEEEQALISLEQRRKEYAAVRKLKNRIFKNHRILYALNGKMSPDHMPTRQSLSMARSAPSRFESIAVCTASA